MKNKYTEVEVVPFFDPQNDISHFCLRNLSKEYDSLNYSRPRLKNKYQKILSTIFVALIFLFPLSTSSQTILNQEVINLTNQQRVNNNLSQLKVNPLLEQAALDKANDMFQDNYFAHFSPTGEKPWDFIIAAGYHYKFAGENLAMDFSSASNAVAAWMTSPTHRENILSLDYDEIGVAVVEGNLQGHNTILIVQMFGRRFDSPVENTYVLVDQFASASAAEPEATLEENSEPEIINQEVKVEPVPAGEIIVREQAEVLDKTDEINPDLEVKNYFFLPSLINYELYDLFFTASGETERIALLKENSLIRFKYLKNNIFQATTDFEYSPFDSNQFQILAFNDFSFNTEDVKLVFNWTDQTRLVKNSRVKGISTVSPGQSALFLFFLIIGAELAFLAPELWHVWHNEKYLFKKQKVDSFLSLIFFILTLLFPYI